MVYFSQIFAINFLTFLDKSVFQVFRGKETVRVSYKQKVSDRKEFITDYRIISRITDSNVLLPLFSYIPGD